LSRPDKTRQECGSHGWVLPPSVSCQGSEKRALALLEPHGERGLAHGPRLLHTCPVSTGGRTRRVRLVREEGGGVLIPRSLSSPRDSTRPPRLILIGHAASLAPSSALRRRAGPAGRGAAGACRDDEGARGRDAGRDGCAGDGELRVGARAAAGAAPAPVLQHFTVKSVFRPRGVLGLWRGTRRVRLVRGEGRGVST